MAKAQVVHAWVPATRSINRFRKEVAPDGDALLGAPLVEPPQLAVAQQAQLLGLEYLPPLGQHRQVSPHLRESTRRGRSQFRKCWQETLGVLRWCCRRASQE